MLMRSGSLYVGATGIWQTPCGKGWKFEAFVNGELIASEYARNEQQRDEKQAAIRQAFSGLPFYER